MPSKIVFFLLPASLMFMPLSLLQGDIKEEICQYNKKLEKAGSSSEKSLLHYNLANAYLKDQELDRAFRSFLLALEEHDLSNQKPGLPEGEKQEEKQLFKEALSEYMNRGVQDPAETARELLEKYGPIAKANPHYLHLHFLLSTSYANIGKFDQFFEDFYRLYPLFKDNFLAYKTRGILAIRLSQSSVTAEERAYFRKKAHTNLEFAFDKNPEDVSLYKVLTFLAKEEGKSESILFYLNKLVETKVVIPRTEITLFVREAASLGELALAEKILAKAKQHYAYSKAIEQAENYLHQLSSSPE